MQSVTGIAAVRALFAAKFGLLLGGRAAVEQDFFREKTVHFRNQAPGGGYENPPRFSYPPPGAWFRKCTVFSLKKILLHGSAPPKEKTKFGCEQGTQGSNPSDTLHVQSHTSGPHCGLVSGGWGGKKGVEHQEKQILRHGQKRIQNFAPRRWWCISAGSLIWGLTLAILGGDVADPEVYSSGSEDQI